MIMVTIFSRCSLCSEIESINDDFIDLMNKTGIVHVDHPYEIDMSKWLSVNPLFSVLVGSGESSIITLNFTNCENGKLTIFESLKDVSLYHIYIRIISDDSIVSLSDSIINSMLNSYIYDMHIRFDVEEIDISNEKANSILCKTIMDSSLFHVGIYFNEMKITLEKSDSNFGMIGNNITSKEIKEISGIFVKGKSLSVKSKEKSLFGSLFYITNNIKLSNSFVDIDNVLLEGSSDWSIGINRISSSIEIFRSFINIRKSLIISCDECTFGSLINSPKFEIKINECWIRLIIDRLESKNLYFGGFVNSIESSIFSIENSNLFISFTNTHLGYDYVKMGLFVNDLDISDNSYITNCVSVIGIYDIISLQFPIYDIYNCIKDEINKYLKLSSVYSNENGVVNCIYISNLGINMKSLSYIESNTNGYKISSNEKWIYYIGIPYFENDKIMDDKRSFESIDISFVNDNIEYLNKRTIYTKSNIPYYNIENENNEYEIYLFPKELEYYDNVLIIQSECKSHIHTSLDYPLALYHPKRDNYYSNNKVVISFSKLNKFESMIHIKPSYMCKINGFIDNKLIEEVDVEIKIHSNYYIWVVIGSAIHFFIITALFILIVYKERGIELIKRHSNDEKGDIPLFLSLMFLSLPIIVGLIIVIVLALPYLAPVFIFSPIFIFIFVVIKKYNGNVMNDCCCFIIILGILGVIGIASLYLFTDFWKIMNSEIGITVLIADGLSCIVGLCYSLILLIAYGVCKYICKIKKEEELNVALPSS